MTRSATINVRVTPDVKQKSEALFSRFGITVSDAVNMFLHQALYEGGLPFQLKQKQPNAELLEAMNESERISRDPHTKKYENAETMMNDIFASN